MPQIKFLPSGKVVDVPANTKILVAAVRNKVDIRFGCAACRCGTCGIAVSGEGQLSAMEDDERALLSRMHLPIDGSIRLACRSKVVAGLTVVDLDFQWTYSPDQGDDI